MVATRCTFRRQGCDLLDNYTLHKIVYPGPDTILETNFVTRPALKVYASDPLYDLLPQESTLIILTVVERACALGVAYH